jgi:coproporphyrinogen III oxidase
MEVFIMGLQQTIVDHLENVEATAAAATSVAPSSTTINNIPQPVSTPAARFNIDRSHRNPDTGMGGGGVVAVLQEGRVFEKAGVNTSVISGMMPLARLQNMRVDHAGLRELLRKHESATAGESSGCPFTAAGISLVLHPHNPHAPTVHANYRMFEVNVGGERVWWFGGGSDLTPTYTSADDFMPLHFHGLHKATCDELQAAQDGLKVDNLYSHLKAWCDDYFYLPHRGETRGVGGIFFDDMDVETAGWGQEELFKMVMRFGDLFPASYFPLVEATAGKAYTEEEKRYQQLRRGRYVEFNVMIDRGTKFGLQMPNSIRTEQILMSLPLTARYEYMFTPEQGSPEAVTQEILQKPIKWV